MSILFNSSGEGTKRLTNIIQGSADYTAMCWFRSTAFNSGVKRPVFAQIDGTATKYAGIFQQNNGITFFEANDGTNISADTSGISQNQAWQHFTYTRSGSTHRWYINGFLIGTVILDLSSASFSEIRLGTAIVYSTGTNTKANYFREWTTALNISEILLERDSITAVKTIDLLTDTPLTSDLLDDSINGNDWTAIGSTSFTTDPILSDIPKNTIPQNATNIPDGTEASPTVLTQDVFYDGLSYEVYFKFSNDTPDSKVISYANWGTIPQVGTSTYGPFVNIYIDLSLDTQIHQGFINGSFGLTPIPPGFTFYYQIARQSNVNPSPLTIKFFTGPTETPSAGMILINAASISQEEIDAGIAGLAAGFIDVDANEIIGYIPEFICGEWGDILPTTGRMLFLDQYAVVAPYPGAFSVNLFMYDANFDLYGTNPVTTLDSNFIRYGIRTHIQSEKWYVFGTSLISNTTVEFKTVDADGNVGSTITTTAIGQTPIVGAANADESIFYIGCFDGSVKRWDIAGGAFLTDLVAPISNYKTSDMLVLSDGTIIVVYLKKTTTRDIILKRYNTSGTVLNTYTLTFAATITSVNPRLGFSKNAEPAFWILNHLTTGYVDIRLIKVSDGTELKTSLTADPNQDFIATDNPILPRTSDCCPIIELAVSPSPPLPTTGSIVVTKVIENEGPVSIFHFSISGGLEPSEFDLEDGQSQVFTDVTPGTYSVIETNPGTGWTTTYEINIGGTNTNLVIEAGDNAIVTVTNNYILNNKTGIYKITPESLKTNDTLWNDGFDGTTNVKIPDPTYKTGPVG